MILNDTVFILGAGAHCSYGFPSGGDLVAQIIKAVDDSIRNRGEYNYLSLASFGVASIGDVQRPRCAAFVQALKGAGQPSIDAFINANRHQVGFEAIGKAAIAQVLLQYESRSSSKGDDDWMSYVFGVMLEGVSSPDQFIKSNKIAFITFNYDRYLERWLFDRIKYSFGIDDDHALRVLSSIPLLHVYGDLGGFPDSVNTKPEQWVKACRSIRTIYDAGHDAKILSACDHLLSAAKSICLLGFGFHQENVELLKLSDHIAACQGVVAGTRYNVTNAELSRYRRFLNVGKITMGGENQRCLEAIRNMPIFY